MGIREKLNEHQSVGIGLAIGLVALTVVWIVSQSRSDAPVAGTSKAWYTDDDGRTFFADDATKIAPFEHNGKTAVGCTVFKEGADGKPFVNHLIRYTAAGRQARETGAAPATGGLMEVKRPLTGDKGWVPITDRAAMAITAPRPPSGSTMRLMPVDPNE